MTMRRIDLQPLEPFTSDFIDRTGAFNPGALEAATAIIEQVRQEGDGALRALTQKFDGVAIENFRVPPEAIDAAMAEVDPDTLEALRHAAAQIRDFHERQKQQSWFFAREDGAIVGSKVTPLESVGIYVPGGRALYPSTVLMNALPAQVAGVERIVCVTPPTKDGTLDAAILAACKIAGVTEIYTVGGAQAVGDYVAGPNHTLPTGGTARYSSPLSVDDFVKKSSIIQYSPAALKNDARAVVQIATHEGLWAHARSVALRLKALLDAEQASVAGSAAAGVEDGEARGE